MNAMLRYGRKPVGLWKLINSLAKARNPERRDQRRCLRLRFWGAIRELLKFRVLCRHGPLIATVNFAVRPRPKSPKRLMPSAASSPIKNGGSNPVVPVVKKTTSGHQVLKAQLVGTSRSIPTAIQATKSATPTVAEIRIAASALARLPRKRKKWSGWLRGVRTWRQMPVVVPGGKILPAYFVRRGFVFALPPDTPEYEGQVFLRYRAEEVQIYRSPHAALLGRLSPRPGSRRRGRPKRG